MVPASHEGKPHVRDKKDHVWVRDLPGVGALGTSSLITISRKFKQAGLTKAARPRFTSLRSAELVRSPGR